MVGYPRPSRQTDKVSARQFERGSGRPLPGSRQPGIAKQILNRPAESRTRNGIVHGPNHFMVGYPRPSRRRRDFKRRHAKPTSKTDRRPPPPSHLLHWNNTHALLDRSHSTTRLVSSHHPG